MKHLKDLLNNSTNDILDIQNQVKEIQLNISIFNKFMNKQKYNNINYFINSSKMEVKNKYSNREMFFLYSYDFLLNINIFLLY